jgi:seryl-tRNA synthetase
MPLDINLFREDKETNSLATVIESQRLRYAPESQVTTIIETDKIWRQCTFDINQLNKSLNALSKEIGLKMKAKENAEELMQKVANIKEELKVKEEEKKSIENTINTTLRMIGNLVHSSVPDSKDERDNRVERQWGQSMINESKIGAGYHHHELLHMIDGYASERGVNVAGHRAYFLKGVGVLLNQALISYGLSFLMGKSYTPLQPPYFMKKEVMAETAQLEQFDEELYKVVSNPNDPETDMYLIATSEQPISAYHRNEWIPEDAVPLRYAGISTCFRKEAGSHGRDAWGLFRIHQFEKVEQFVITAPDQSWAMQEEMIAICEEFYQSLKLPYHIINIVSGALNNAAAKKLDLEAFFPKLGVYRELVSCSNCTDYQSRAMETRFGMGGKKGGEKKYVHMLNATLCATERTICCILENYQTDEGVIVPEVLRPFMGGLEIMKFVNAPPKPTAATIANVGVGKKE